LRAGRLVPHGQLQPRDVGQPRLQQAALQRDRDPMLLVVRALRLHRRGDGLGKLAQHREAERLRAARYGDVHRRSIDA
jgi:hypothetical protein